MKPNPWDLTKSGLLNGHHNLHIRDITKKGSLMPFYPAIKDDTILTLQLVVKSLEKDPQFLDHPDCPYSEVAKAYFLSTTVKGTVVNLFEGEDEVEVIDTQIQRVLSDLEAMGPQMARAETNERLAYFKAKTTLLEKLINMKERVFNLKELSDFRSTLISAIEDLCTKDQISDFMKRLDGILGTGQE